MLLAPHGDPLERLPELRREIDASLLGVLSVERLDQHFAADRRLRVHGDRCREYFAVLPDIPVVSMVVTQLMMSSRSIGYSASCRIAPRRRSRTPSCTRT